MHRLSRIDNGTTPASTDFDVTVRSPSGANILYDLEFVNGQITDTIATELLDVVIGSSVDGHVSGSDQDRFIGAADELEVHNSSTGAELEAVVNGESHRLSPGETLTFPLSEPTPPSGGDDLNLLCGFSSKTVAEGGTAFLPAQVTSSVDDFLEGKVRWFRESDGAFVAGEDFIISGGETLNASTEVSWQTLHDRLGSGDHSLFAQIHDVEPFATPQASPTATCGTITVEPPDTAPPPPDDEPTQFDPSLVSIVGCGLEPETIRADGATNARITIRNDNPSGLAARASVIVNVDGSFWNEGGTSVPGGGNTDVVNIELSGVPEGRHDIDPELGVVSEARPALASVADAARAIDRGTALAAGAGLAGGVGSLLLRR